MHIPLLQLLNWVRFSVHSLKCIDITRSFFYTQLKFNLRNWDFSAVLKVLLCWLLEGYLVSMLSAFVGLTPLFPSRLGVGPCMSLAASRLGLSCSWAPEKRSQFVLDAPPHVDLPSATLSGWYRKIWAPPGKVVQNLRACLELVPLPCAPTPHPISGLRQVAEGGLWPNPGLNSLS